MEPFHGLLSIPSEGSSMLVLVCSDVVAHTWRTRGIILARYITLTDISAAMWHTRGGHVASYLARHITLTDIS